MMIAQVPPTAAVFDQDVVYASVADWSREYGVVTYERASPPEGWDAEAAERILDIVRLKDIGNSVGSPRVDARAAFHARQIAHRLSERGAPRPFIAPLEGGGLSFEWESSVVVCELAVNPQGDLSLYYRLMPTDESWEGDLGDSPRDLSWLLEYLTPPRVS